MYQHVKHGPEVYALEGSQAYKSDAKHAMNIGLTLATSVKGLTST
jgi:hypothetical protein